MRTLAKTASVIAIVGLAATFQNCVNTQAIVEQEDKKTVTEVPSPETFTLQKGQVSSNLQIPGELTAFQQVDLYAKVSSFVKKLYADVGTEVHQGQLLATMEAPEISAQLSGASSKLKAQEAIYQASKANYDRLVETSKTPGTVSQSDLDFALAKQNSDFSQLDALKSTQNEITENRNYLEIRAPFSGIISARNVSAGAYVGPSGKGSEFPLFTLVEQRKLRLVVSVPEAYSASLNAKSEVTFTVKSLPNQTFTAKVSRQAGMLDNRLRSQRTEMDVINNDRKLLPGMITEVSVPLQGSTNAFVVPKSAVLNSTQGVYLIKVINGKAEWFPIKTGNSDAEHQEIFGDLKEGDVIVKSANEEIRDDSPVKPATKTSEK
jgi:membrane fusion protein (multidrug efflux system)